jgi:hypothetical protein
VLLLLPTLAALLAAALAAPLAAAAAALLAGARSGSGAALRAIAPTGLRSFPRACVLKPGANASWIANTPTDAAAGWPVERAGGCARRTSPTTPTPNYSRASCAAYWRLTFAKRFCGAHARARLCELGNAAVRGAQRGELYGRPRGS